MSAAEAPVIDAARFRETLGHVPTGVVAVTAIASSGEPLALVIGSFVSVSLDPPLVGFLPMRSSQTFAQLREAETFCVNVLAADQEALCRQLAGRGEKFAGVAWRLGPGGAPILDGAVASIECTWDTVVDAGDHYFVLARVRDLAVQRSTLPLLFFQGGYGKFALPSVVAADPDLLEAAQVAESIRDLVEASSRSLAMDCVIRTSVRGEAVTVLAVAGAPGSVGPGVGARIPHLAPLGSVLVDPADPAAVQAWCDHLAPAGPEVMGRLSDNLERVHERGYSVSLRSEGTPERIASLADYSSPTCGPQQARRIRTLIADSVDLYEPEMCPESTYEVYAVSVPVPLLGGIPLALRWSGMPAATGREIEGWIAQMQAVAASAGARLR